MYLSRSMIPSTSNPCENVSVRARPPSEICATRETARESVRVTVSWGETTADLWRLSESETETVSARLAFAVRVAVRVAETDIVSDRTSPLENGAPPGWTLSSRLAGVPIWPVSATLPLRTNHQP